MGLGEHVGVYCPQKDEPAWFYKAQVPKNIHTIVATWLERCSSDGSP